MIKGSNYILWCIFPDLHKHPKGPNRFSFEPPSILVDLIDNIANIWPISSKLVFPTRFQSFQLRLNLDSLSRCPGFVSFQIQHLGFSIFDVGIEMFVMIISSGDLSKE